MAKKSIVINLPIVPYHQSKHSDVVQYLEVLQELHTEVYAPDERIIAEKVSQLEKLERTETLLKGVWKECYNKVYLFFDNQLLTCGVSGVSTGF